MIKTNDNLAEIALVRIKILFILGTSLKGQCIIISKISVTVSCQCSYLISEKGIQEKDSV